jgi:hypothetical protein
MEEVERFDWSDKKALVVRRVDAIAVYMDSEGDIIIRQQHPDVPIDSVITIPAQHAYSVIEGLQRQLKGPFVAPVAVAAGA